MAIDGADSGTANPTTAPAPDAAVQPTEFSGSLGGDLSQNEALYGFEDANSLAQAFVETRTKATEAEARIAELEGKVPAIPNSADAYEISVPEGYDASPENLQAFQAFAHENGLTNDSVNALLSFDHQRMQAAQEAQMANEQQAIESLKKEWGDDFAKKVDSAKRAVKEIGGDELVQFMEESRLGNNAQLVKMFAKIATAISEDSMLTGGTNTKPKAGLSKTEDGRPILSVFNQYNKE